MKRKIQIEYGPKIHIVETEEVISMTLVLSTRTPNTRFVSAVCSRSFVDLSSQLITTRSIASHPRIASHFR
jgi:hypothetical protein